VTGLGRTPPRSVIRLLRQEVGQCCPVEGCGSPYLTWHHFDPPWRIEHHHRPEGMIALCRPHADKADHGSFTDDQLRELKRDGKFRAAEVRGRFDWMRQDLLARVGGNFYYRQDLIFRISNVPCIWFDRDEQGYMLLSFKMPTMSGCARAQIDQNFWSVTPAVEEVVCPPSGRLVEVSYHNGDKFRAEFFNVASADALAERYPQSWTYNWSGCVQFPVTVVELWETAAGTSIQVGPDFSLLHRTRVYDNFVIGGGKGAGLSTDVSSKQLALLFPEPNSDAAPSPSS
jgi:hypothetical protein